MLEEQKRSELTVYWTQVQASVRSYIMMSIRDRHAADDVLQEVAVAIARDFDSYDSGRSFKAWAMGVARFRILQYLNKTKRDHIIFDDKLLSSISKEVEKISAAQIEYEEALEHCLEALSDKATEVVRMKYARSLRVREIAEITGRTQGAVTGLLRRARTLLCDCITQRVLEVDNG